MSSKRRLSNIASICSTFLLGFYAVFFELFSLLTNGAPVRGTLGSPAVTARGLIPIPIDRYEGSADSERGFRMLSKLDPLIAAIAAIEGRAADQLRLMLGIVGRLNEKYPVEFGTKHHSIVQRLLRAFRRKATDLVAQKSLATPRPLPFALGCLGTNRLQPPPTKQLGRPPGAADVPRCPPTHIDSVQ